MRLKVVGAVAIEDQQGRVWPSCVGVFAIGVGCKGAGWQRVGLQPLLCRLRGLRDYRPPLGGHGVMGCTGLVGGYGVSPGRMYGMIGEVMENGLVVEGAMTGRRDREFETAVMLLPLCCRNKGCWARWRWVRSSSVAGWRADGVAKAFVGVVWWLEGGVDDWVAMWRGGRPWM